MECSLGKNDENKKTFYEIIITGLVQMIGLVYIVI